MKNILSIDQSINNSGVTIKTDTYTYFSISPDKEKSTVEKLAHIRDEICSFIEKYKIALVIREGFSFASHSGRMFDLGGLGFMIDLLCYDRAVELMIIPPTTHKKFTTGKGNSNKSVMLLHVFKKYGIELNDDNIADSLSMMKLYEASQRYLSGDVTNLNKAEKEAIISLLKGKE